MRILVATDGSRAGLAAVRFGMRLAGEDGSRHLTVLTVYAGPETGLAAAQGSAEKRYAERVLERAAREVSRRGSPPARFELVRLETPMRFRRPSPGRPIASRPIWWSWGARAGLAEGMVVGGTALRLIYVARRPVTVVRAPRRRARAGAAPRRAASGR